MIEYDFVSKVWPQEHRKEGTAEALAKVGPWLTELAKDGWRVVPGTLNHGFWGSNELAVSVLLERERLLSFNGFVDSAGDDSELNLD